jgi:hypothetical protein
VWSEPPAPVWEGAAIRNRAGKPRESSRRLIIAKPRFQRPRMGDRRAVTKGNGNGAE